MPDCVFSVDTIALKKLMLDNDVKSILELSEKSGVDRNILGAMLAGNKRPSSRTMDSIVCALHISPEEAGKIFFADNLHNQ